jgi:hypothetical protein
MQETTLNYQANLIREDADDALDSVVYFLKEFKP